MFNIFILDYQDDEKYQKTMWGMFCGTPCMYSSNFVMLKICPKSSFNVKSMNSVYQKCPIYFDLGKILQDTLELLTIDKQIIAKFDSSKKNDNQKYINFSFLTRF